MVVKVSSVKLTTPNAAAGEIVRKNLLQTVLNSHSKLTYIHGGAGYGKTTLLAQIANAGQNAIWFSLDGENDVFFFIDILRDAVRKTFAEYDFSAVEYLLFEENENFITILANAFISSMERLERDMMIILDDLHTVKDLQVRELITSLIKYMPENIRLFFSSRETPWQELVALRVRGRILELTQQEIAFTREETFQVLGFNDEKIYNLTEGWPLAIGSYKVLLENGASLGDISVKNTEILYSYLFQECLTHLSTELVDFLKAAACFDELDTKMLNNVLKKKNSRLILESLFVHNFFIAKVDRAHYRFHTLFKNFLLESVEKSERSFLQQKALHYYLHKQDFSRAARYAILSEDSNMLQQIILTCYEEYIKQGMYSILGGWFQALDDMVASSSSKILIARGALLSSMGKFSEANICLDTVIPLLTAKDKDLYVEAMLHKARVLRNFVSFQESNKVLDELIIQLDNLDSKVIYTVMIEKVYNLCWNSEIKEAYAVLQKMIKNCANAGEIRVKAWYERYLTSIHFFAGRMKDVVFYYEKSQELPENERRYLDMHNIGIFAAKAYQMLGHNNKATSLISMELQKLRSMGRYEELWAGYLLAAEIHYEDTILNRLNGGSQSFETALKYFTLADEYAPLYRCTEFQLQWARIQRLVTSLTFTHDPKQDIIDEILTNLDNINDYLKTLVLGRLIGYYYHTGNYKNTVKYAQLAIETGERSDIMMVPTIAIGILANAAIAANDYTLATRFTKRHLQLCEKNGIYLYFKFYKSYMPVLEYAFENRIEIEFTKKMMSLAGYKPKKVYIKTFGSFSVFSYKNRQEPVKIRTKKGRELLAFLLHAGREGTTKEQIYNAIWQETESKDVKKLIGVNLAQIKRGLTNLGVENPIINHNTYYSICMDEIVIDSVLFEEAAEKFKLDKSTETAQAILSLYKGEYLSDLGAHWAISKRIEYNEIYQSALTFINPS